MRSSHHPPASIAAIQVWVLCLRARRASERNRRGRVVRGKRQRARKGARVRAREISAAIIDQCQVYCKAFIDLFQVHDASGSGHELDLVGVEQTGPPLSTCQCVSQIPLSPSLLGVCIYICVHACACACARVRLLYYVRARVGSGAAVCARACVCARARARPCVCASRAHACLPPCAHKTLPESR